MLAVIKDNTNMIDTKTKWNMKNTAISSIVQALGSNDVDTSLDNNGIEGNNINKQQRLLDVIVYQFSIRTYRFI